MPDVVLLGGMFRTRGNTIRFPVLGIRSCAIDLMPHTTCCVDSSSNDLQWIVNGAIVGNREVTLKFELIIAGRYLENKGTNIPRFQSSIISDLLYFPIIDSNFPVHIVSEQYWTNCVARSIDCIHNVLVFLCVSRPRFVVLLTILCTATRCDCGGSARPLKKNWNPHKQSVLQQS